MGEGERREKPQTTGSTPTNRRAHPELHQAIPHSYERPVHEGMVIFGMRNCTNATDRKRARHHIKQEKAMHASRAMGPNVRLSAHSLPAARTRPSGVGGKGWTQGPLVEEYLGEGIIRQPVARCVGLPTGTSTRTHHSHPLRLLISGAARPPRLKPLSPPPPPPLRRQPRHPARPLPPPVARARAPPQAWG